MRGDDPRVHQGVIRPAAILARSAVTAFLVINHAFARAEFALGFLVCQLLVKPGFLDVLRIVFARGRRQLVRGHPLIWQNQLATWLADGGGNGSIIGRNTFQRPREEALKMLGHIIGIYRGEA